MLPLCGLAIPSRKLTVARTAAALVLFASTLTTVAAQDKAARSSAPTDEASLARDHFREGRAAYAAGKLEEARMHFEAADALVPSPELAFNLARVCERSGRAAEAVRYYERYLQSELPSKQERRELTSRKRKLQELSKRQREQLKHAPPSAAEVTAEARRFFERGLRLYRRGKLQGALAALMAAHQLHETPELLYNLATISEALGHPRDAVDYYRAYLKQRPDAEDAAKVQARIAQLEGQRRSAR